VPITATLPQGTLAGALIQTLTLGGRNHTRSVVALGQIELNRWRKRVMRGDLAAMWIAYAANFILWDITLTIASYANRPTASLADLANDLSSSSDRRVAELSEIMSRVGPQHLLPQDMSAFREPSKTKLTRTGRRYPYAYPAGGPLKLPLRPSS